MDQLFCRSFNLNNRFRNIFFIMGLLLGVCISSSVLGQNYDFDDGTTQGWTWHVNEPYNNWDGAIFVWDDYVDYPYFPYDALGNNHGSISIQTPEEIVDSPDAIEFEFRSPDLSGSSEWQNAAGWTAQLLFLGDMWPGDPFPGSYVELTTGHGLLVDEPLEVWSGSGWQEITTVFPADLDPFSWISLRFDYPEGLEGVYGGIFLDDVRPLAVIALPPVSDVIVLDGYPNSIPLAWGVPEGQGGKAFEQNNSLLRSQKSTALTGYNIYRSQALNQSYSKIASNVTHQYYRDYSVSTDQTYYYRITAVYDEGESAYSEAFQGQAASTGTGFNINSNWTSTTPTLDGVINSNEWSDAAAIDITYNGQSGNVTLYVMNNNSKLFLAVDNASDQNLDDWDNCSLFIDANHDGEWPSTTSSPEGMLRFYWDNASSTALSTYMGISGTWPDNLVSDDNIIPAGTNQGISLSSGNMQYEISIDFNTVPLNASGGDLIDLLVFVWDNFNAEFNGLWPAESEQLAPLVDGYLWSYVPLAYGDLRIALFPSDLDHSVQSDRQFILYQNFPNPFNPITKIQYQLKLNSKVELDIYDIQGKKVTTLVSDELPVGNYEVEWDASGLTSGIYICRLKTNQKFIQTRKLILMK